MVSEDVLLKCMELEWQDHFQTRIQTWRSLEIVAIIAIALIGIDWQLDNFFATLTVAILLILESIFGSLITIHHRNNVEVKKINRILEIEDTLKIRQRYYSSESPPKKISFKDVLSFKSNTSLFILRSHIIFIIFGFIYFFYYVFKILN